LSICSGAPGSAEAGALLYLALVGALALRAFARRDL